VKGNKYIYGLTDDKLLKLKQAGFLKIEDLAMASDDAIRAIDGVGVAWFKRIRDVVTQAVWM
jgi:DNA integrity scanning protein DisA with diadenylate cyclase activity